MGVSAGVLEACGQRAAAVRRDEEFEHLGDRATMPASKQRSQSPAARSADAPGHAARSPSPGLIKARHSRYKDLAGDEPWLPDLQRACELAAVLFLLLPGLFMDSFVETPWGQAALQRLCVFMTGACVLGRFLFAVPVPKSPISVEKAKNDRLIVHEHQSASQLETALELALPEVSGDKHNSTYYVSPPGKGVKGLWYQQDRDQAPLFVPCAELLADSAGRYAVQPDEAKQTESALFATNPTVQKSNLESGLKKRWSVSATHVEQIVFAIYGLLGFSVLRPSHGFNPLSILAVAVAAAFAGFLHVVGLGLNDRPVHANLGGMAISLPVAVWKRDLNARKAVRHQPHLPCRRLALFTPVAPRSDLLAALADGVPGRRTSDLDAEGHGRGNALRRPGYRRHCDGDPASLRPAGAAFDRRVATEGPYPDHFRALRGASAAPVPPDVSLRVVPCTNAGVSLHPAAEGPRTGDAAALRRALWHRARVLERQARGMQGDLHEA